MNINFKTRHFSRWAAKVGLSNAVLKDAVSEMQAGLIDADLGGGLVKKRVAFPVEVSEVAPARYWRPTEPIGGFIFMVSRKMKGTTLQRKSWTLCVY